LFDDDELTDYNQSIAAADKEQFIQARASALQIRWSTHALGELAEDRLTVSEVERALSQATVLEDYIQTNRYLPDCLVLAFSQNSEPIHAVIAVNEAQDYILVVTVYRPNLKEWESDWRTRK